MKDNDFSAKVERFWSHNASNIRCVREADFDRVTAERDAALVEVERLKNMNHRQILAESAAKYLLDSGAENFVGDVFTIEADDGQTKFEVIVTTQKVGAKSPGELCNELQQRLTAAERRVGVLEQEVERLNRVKLALNELAERRADNCSVYRQHLSDALTMAEKVRNASLGMQRKYLSDLIVHLYQNSGAALKPAEGGGDELKPANPRRILSDPHCSKCGHPDCNGQCFGDDMMGD